MADVETQQIRVSSLYRHANATRIDDSPGGKDDDAVVFQVPERLSYEDREDNTIHIVTEGERIYDLAQAYFARVIPNGIDIWEVLAQYQPEPIVDPSVPLAAGREIFIPPTDYIDEIALGAVLIEVPEI
jgi:hypothetical protein